MCIRDRGLIDFIHEIDGSGGCFLQMPGGGSLNPSTRETVDKKMHYVHQDGQQVFKFAVRKQTEACLKLLERNGLTGADIDAFIPHQANLRIINATADRLGLRPESVIVNIERYGNTTAGTIPLAMNTAIEDGKLKKGSLVLMASVGAGSVSYTHLGFPFTFLHQKSQALRRIINIAAKPGSPLAFVRMIQVRHRSHATYSRQPRQVRKEATVTGSCVCSGVPVPGLFSFPAFRNCTPQTARLKFDNSLQLFAQESKFHFVSG